MVQQGGWKEKVTNVCKQVITTTLDIDGETW